jgi:hypothetical protein
MHPPAGHQAQIAGIDFNTLLPIETQFRKSNLDELANRMRLAYRWFCRLGLDVNVLDHFTFSVNRNGRFRDSDLFRQVFEAVVRACMDAGLVKGEAFAVDASVMEADAMPLDRADLEPDSKAYARARRLTPSCMAARVTKARRVSARFS